MRNKIILIFTTAFICINLIFFSNFTIAAPETTDNYDFYAVVKILDNTKITDLKTKSAILIDSDYGNTLFEKDSHEKLPIASVTKVMTMLLIMDAIDSGKLGFDDKVTVTEYAASMGGSQAYLKSGEEFTVTEMLKAVAIHSSNDACVALAEKVAGSESTFVDNMNQKAQSLGMHDTYFTDCTGLSDTDAYSSANDVAIMSREIINNHPKIIDFTSIWHDTFRNGTFSLDNTNKLIKLYPGVDGLKTGFTSKAGNCLSSTAVKNNFRLIAVVLGEPDTNTRFAESKKLLEYGFSNYELVTIHKKGDLIGTTKVKKGTTSQVNVVYGTDAKVPVMKSEKSKITTQSTIVPVLIAPVNENQKAGEVVFKVGDKIVGTSEAVTQTSVTKASFITLFSRIFLGWLGIGN